MSGGVKKLDNACIFSLLLVPASYMVLIHCVDVVLFYMQTETLFVKVSNSVMYVFFLIFLGIRFGKSALPVAPLSMILAILAFFVQFVLSMISLIVKGLSSPAFSISAVDMDFFLILIRSTAIGFIAALLMVGTIAVVVRGLSRK